MKDKHITKVLEDFRKRFMGVGSPGTDGNFYMRHNEIVEFITTAILEERNSCTQEVLEVVKKQQIQDSINKFNHQEVVKGI